MNEEKRFVLCDKTTDSNVWDTQEKQCYGWEYVVWLLNALHEENRLLQMRYEAQKELYGKLDCQYNKLRKENEELIDEVDDLNRAFYNISSLVELDQENKKLHEENKELRKDVIYWRHKALNDEPVNCRCQMEDLE